MNKKQSNIFISFLNDILPINIIKKFTRFYQGYSEEVLLKWKVEPIALIITILTYQGPWLALKIYIAVTLSIHMPVIFYRAYKKL